jgi:hypothetical protein
MDDDYDPARFRADLEAKDALRDCPCCGSNDWQLPEDGLVTLPMTVSEAGVDHRVKASMECAPVICGNCDFVRLQSLGLYLG